MESASELDCSIQFCWLDCDWHLKTYIIGFWIWIVNLVFSFQYKSEKSEFFIIKLNFHIFTKKEPSQTHFNQISINYFEINLLMIKEAPPLEVHDSKINKMFNCFNSSALYYVLITFIVNQIFVSPTNCNIITFQNPDHTSDDFYRFRNDRTR